MKRTLTALICICALLAFAACGNRGSSGSSSQRAASPEPSGPVNLVFWTMWDGGDVNVAMRIFNEYNAANPNVNIDFQQQDFNQFATKLKTGIMGEQGPDFAISYVGGFITGLQADDMLVPISAEARRLGVPIDFTAYTPAPMEATKVNGEYYGVPCDNLVRVLMYNKEILANTGVLDANGRLILTPGYDNFKAMMQRVKTARPDVATLALTMRPPQLVLGWLTLYEQMGGHAFIDLAAKRCVFDDAIALRALETYHDIYVNFVPENLAPPADLEMFRTGRAAFYIDGAWNVAAAAEALGDKFGVTTFPQLGERNALVTTNHAFIIPKSDTLTDAKTRAILEFIKYWGENNWKWSEAGHLPAYTPSTRRPEFASMPWPGFYVSTMDVAVPIYTIPNANLHQIPATTDPIQRGVRGTISPAEAIREVKSNLNALIPQL